MTKKSFGSKTGVSKGKSDWYVRRTQRLPDSCTVFIPTDHTGGVGKRNRILVPSDKRDSSVFYMWFGEMERARPPKIFHFG